MNAVWALLAGLGIGGLCLIGCLRANRGDSGEDSARSARPTEPRRFELVQDKEVSLGSGAHARLKTVLEAHLSDSQNELTMLVTIRRDGRSEEVQLQRTYPRGPVYTSVLGLKLAIDFVDAYHQPATGAILVLPDQAPTAVP